MTMIEIFITAFGGSATVILVAAYLGKQFIGLQVSREIEKYKSELEQRSSVLKTELSIYAHEQNVGLSRIDAQRSKAIQEIYNIITQWHDIFLDITAANDYFDETPDVEFNRFYNLSEKLAKLSNKLSVSVRNNAIFFDLETYSTISNYGSNLTELGLRFYSDTFENLDISTNINFEETVPSIRGARINLHDKAKNDSEKFREALLAEFRHLLKSDHNSNHNLK